MVKPKIVDPLPRGGHIPFTRRDHPSFKHVSARITRRKANVLWICLEEQTTRFSMIELNHIWVHIRVKEPAKAWINRHLEIIPWKCIILCTLHMWLSYSRSNYLKSVSLLGNLKFTIQCLYFVTELKLLSHNKLMFIDRIVISGDWVVTHIAFSYGQRPHWACSIKDAHSELCQTVVYFWHRSLFSEGKNIFHLNSGLIGRKWKHDQWRYPSLSVHRLYNKD